MINFDTLRDEFAKLADVILFNEEGELYDFVRNETNVNDIDKPVCGTWHVNPIPMTAVRKPFCGIASVDITVLSHPNEWEKTVNKMNEAASALNGTSKEMTVDGITYSVSYNCQTCGVGNRILDVNIGYGEVVEIRQQISYIIIEAGVSAYDVSITIDGLQIPILSLVENKIHTTSNAPDAQGILKTMSEQEAYGIDFIIPYMRDDVGNLVRDVIDRSTGNEAHCVVLDIAGKKSCHIMQFTHVSSNVQPPQNIGMNVSMTEIDPHAAKYNDMWETESVYGKFATINLEKKGAKLDINERGDNINGFVVFWGDGTSQLCKKEETPYHVYADDKPHEIIIFTSPILHYKPISKGSGLLGKILYFRFPENIKKIECKDLQFIMFGNDFDNPDVEEETFSIGDRAAFQVGLKKYYIDAEEDGKFFIINGQKVQNLVDKISSFTSETKQYIFTSVWD